ncbi:S41 family peptidase [Cognatilysobacter terrigena]|uniref:S41 family peptidase n=1 Tax=Cognatilysobacter terrigena TaxID=2488749 RepID=UPI001414F645|nr:S41 family peptidase [Lysobacter terrigena]
MRSLLPVVFAFVTTAASAAAPEPAPPPSRLDGAALVADVDVLEKAYVRLHPGLYRYASEAEVARRFDRLRGELRDGATLPEAYAAFSRFAATVKCGHTYANFYNQPASVRAALFESGRTRLPFHFRWLDGRMIVVRAAPQAAMLVPGTEVVSIDGVPAKKVLAALMPYARADGSNDAKRVAQLEVLGHEKYEPFDVFFPLAFPAPDDDFDLVVRPPSETAPRRVRVTGVTWAERLAMRPDATKNEAAPWTLERIRPDIAVLDMPTWALYDSKWDWKGFLADTLTRLEADHVANLVIDLRANEGGMDVGDELLAHLVRDPVARPVYRPLVRYRVVPSDLRPYLDTWDRSFDDWGDDAKPFDDRYYLMTRWQPADGSDAVKPEAPHYNGAVYVLTSSTNSSATFQFAQLVQASGRAMLVGEPTGGNLRGINGSAFYFLRLPNSGIELDLPLVAQMPVTPQPDRGIQPDIPALPTQASIANGDDVALAAVIAEVDRKRR